MTASIESFKREFVKSLEEGTAAILVGAGMSRATGFVDWKGLLRDIANELELDVDRESDLVAIAQYHKNHVGNRSRLDQLLIEEFTRDVAFTGSRSNGMASRHACLTCTRRTTGSRMTDITISGSGWKTQPYERVDRSRAPAKLQPEPVQSGFLYRRSLALLVSEVGSSGSTLLVATRDDGQM